MTDPDAFLRRFFGPGNDYNLPPGWKHDERFARLAPFVEDVASTPARPVLLPRRRGRQFYVYAKAFGAPMGRRLAEALAAFVGPTYAHFDATPATPRAGDPVETAIGELGAGPMWRIEVPKTSWKGAWEALRLLRVVWLERPLRGTDDVVPVGRLLRDFRISLVGGDEHLSAICLQQLAASGAFDAANVAFLRVRRHDALGFPERALDGPEADDLFRMRLPTAVREVLLTAVHRRHLADAAARREPDAARDALVQHPQFASLLTGPARLERADAQAALVALAFTFPASADTAALRTATQQTQDPWLRALHERLSPRHPPTRPGTSALAEVRYLFEADAYDAAWRVIETLPDGVVRDRLAVHCALSLADPGRTAEVHRSLARRGADYVHEVLTQQWQFDAWQRHLDRTGLLGPGIPRDWFDFLERITAGEDLSGISSSLDELVRPWPAPTANDHALAGMLAQVPLEPPAVTVVLDALPLLLDAFEEGRAGESSGVAMSLILLSEEFNEAALVALTLALRSFLLAGPNADRYREVVRSLSDVAPQLVQVRTVDRVLDLVDLLLAGPAVDEGTRATVCHDLLARVRRLGRRLSAAQVILAGELSAEAGLDLTWPSPAELAARAEGQPAPAGRRVILLYSLQERVLDRVRRTLLRVAPWLTVHTSGEHDGSDRLKDQAQASDVVLVATRRATHAATAFIERWTTGEVRYVPGAGSASMLHTALEVLRHPGDDPLP